MAGTRNSLYVETQTRQDNHADLKELCCLLPAGITGVNPGGVAPSRSLVGTLRSE